MWGGRGSGGLTSIWRSSTRGGYGRGRGWTEIENIGEFLKIVYSYLCFLNNYILKVRSPDRPHVTITVFFQIQRIPTCEVFFNYLFQCNGTPFQHKPPSDFAAVLFELPPPQCPTTVQTRRHAMRSSCPECVTVMLSAISPPQRSHH